MTDETPDPMAVFQPVWAAVGHVASAYGGLEIGIRQTLEDLLGETDHARVVADALSTDVVITVCLRLLDEVPAYVVAAPLGTWILKAVRRAGNERASVAHGAWYLEERGPEDFVGVRMPVRGGKVLKLSPEAIREQGNMMMMLRVMLGNVGHMAREAIPPSAFASGDPMRTLHDKLVAQWDLKPFPFET